MGHFITQLCTTVHPASAAALGGFCCFDLEEGFEPACVELTEPETLQSADLTAEKHSPSSHSVTHTRKDGNVNLLLFSVERRGGSIRECRGSALWGDVLAEELLKWREVIFASRVLCQARAALGLPPLPLYCWMLNQLFVLPSTVPGTNSLAEGWGNGME